MKKRDKYMALLGQAADHRRTANEYMVLARTLKSAADDLRKRSMTGMFWGKKEAK